MNKELEPPGELQGSMKYNFNFKQVGLPYETYEGANVFVK